MIEKLKRFFPSIQHYRTIPTKLNDKYKWFLTEDSQLIGIEPNELDEKDNALLHTLLKPYYSLFPKMTDAEEKWYEWINNKRTIPNTNLTYRFVYFQIVPNQIEPQTFNEAIRQLFDSEMHLLWETETTGIMIEVIESENTLSYKEIIDTLMSDLYINIRFFVGPYQTELPNVRQYYHYILEWAKISFLYSQNNVITYLDAIPFIFVEQSNLSFKKTVISLVLQEFQDDNEFAKIMEVFLESNLNISVAAKKLYMHRNSLQYRIDKFQEKTGIDVRNFHQAVSVYLALLANSK
ncbi:PucR family transcriptional regulator [Ornithinibacillus halotolerans]|uniref:PucR C-terminal helix-turn-helix domain-containing protein n=1 Tax=Ornithinibacillus halotolerans TaxID=1274357 RepID=A0A916RVM1_9BACI|nr:helix-turn-helix domain-containing protein [Ornithinibacillus halotolerans]GGA73290.1 hypothetical protein GCM10008025_16280 [Ornithinibacillus halotolerans]